VKLLACVVAAITVVAAPPADARGPVVRPTQAIAKLLTSHKAVSSLHGHRSWVTRVSARRPITGGQTVLPVMSRATTAGGARWLRVMLPGRPNGRQGWIEQRGTVLTTTRWHIVVRTGSRHVLAYRDGRLVRSFRAVVGKPSTPTPRGRFFVEESIRMPATAAGAPYALATSARSNVLQEFEGGPGQIGIHGVQNLGGTPGTAISHGCVRLADGPIRWLAGRIAPGVPVTITA
jgi:lipoprotein-anchoring transpeptidase ErfK/SrfK